MLNFLYKIILELYQMIDQNGHTPPSAMLVVINDEQMNFTDYQYYIQKTDTYSYNTQALAALAIPSLFGIIISCYFALPEQIEYPNNIVIV